MSTTDPRATIVIEKVKTEKRGSLDIADFSIPCLGPETASMWNQLGRYWFTGSSLWIVHASLVWCMMHSDNIRHAELRFLYMTTNCAFVTVGPFPFHDQLHGFLQHLASKWFGRVILTAIQTIFQCEELSDTPNWASFVWQQTVLSLVLDHFLFEYMKGLQQINPYSNMRNRQEINEIVFN